MWDAELLSVSSWSKLFAYSSIVVNSWLRIKQSPVFITRWVITLAKIYLLKLWDSKIKRPMWPQIAHLRDHEHLTLWPTFDPATNILTNLWLVFSQESEQDFSAILFLLLAQSSSNSPQSFQRFRRTLVQNFIQIRHRVKNFPIDPNCRNWPF